MLSRGHWFNWFMLMCDHPTEVLVCKADQQKRKMEGLQHALTMALQTQEQLEHQRDALEARLSEVTSMPPWPCNPTSISTIGMRPHLGIQIPLFWRLSL